MRPLPAGEPKTDTSTSEDGTKRIITKTGVFSGTELHLWAMLPHFDARLPARADRPDLDFSTQQRAVSTDEDWQQVGLAGRGAGTARRAVAGREAVLSCAQLIAPPAASLPAPAAAPRS
jgi:hypothetical protein